MNSKHNAATDFDLERYLDNSRKVITSDLDFSKANDYPLTPDEVRCLSYMMDVESHTIGRLPGQSWFNLISNRQHSGMSMAGEEYHSGSC